MMSNGKKIWRIVLGLGKTWPVKDAKPEGETIPDEPVYAPFVTECVMCRSCELACAVFREKENNPKLARIHLKSRELEWIEGTSDKLVEVAVCRQCPGVPPCMAACPVEAMYRDKKTGAVVIDDRICTRCLKCVDECPYGAIWYNKSANKVLKCDLCGGEPKCLEWCPVQCLRLEKE